MHMRIEHDTMGEIEVPDEALWERKRKEACRTLK